MTPALFFSRGADRVMSRREFFRLLLMGALGTCLPTEVSAHTPYRQWKVLRERFLLVHSTRSDPTSDNIAEQLVTILDEVLPTARAMVARAPDEQRIASLMTTGQAVLSVMRSDLAEDLYLGRGAFRGFDGEQLRWLVTSGAHRLVTIASFPQHHAWLVTAALSENGAALDIRPPSANADDIPLPPHPGALAFARGESLDTQQE